MEPDSFSKKLLRQVKRYLKIDTSLQTHGLESNTEEEISEYKENLASNLPAFLNAIDKSYSGYEDKIKMALRNLELSSSELNEANSELEKLNININAMLDSLEEGLLFFTKDGMVSPVFSKSCTKIFLISPGEKHLSELINLNSEEKENLELWLSVIFDENTAMGFDDLEDLAPTHFINNDGCYIGLQYRPMYLQKNVLNSVLLIATDLTEKLTAEQKIEHMKNEAELIISITNNKNNFVSFMKDFKNYLENFKLQENSIEILHSLHTYKGIAMTFRLGTIATSLHNLEVTIKSESHKKNPIEKQITNLLKLLDETNDYCKELLDIDAYQISRTIEIDSNKIDDLIHLFESKVENKDIGQELISYVEEHLKSKPIRYHLKPIENEITRIATSQNKNEPKFTYINCDELINYTKNKAVFDELIHLARNIADHGIEKSDIRQSQGKTDHATISIEFDTTDSKNFRLRLSDDGAGIDPALIRKKMAKNGKDVSNETDEEIINHIFDSTFSTKEKTSQVSGQGIGMAALKKAIIKLDGSVEVQSKLNEGTAFTIKWPK